MGSRCLNQKHGIYYSNFICYKTIMINQFLHLIFNSVFPNHCLLCNKKSNTGKDICDRCWIDLPWLLSCCYQCAKPINIAHNEPLYCGDCLKDPPPFDATIAPLQYQREIISLITKMKFYDNLSATRFFAELITEKIMAQASFNEFPELLIPVPLHPKRLRQRGYNQATLIAKHVSKLTQIPTTYKLCKRIRYTTAQSKTSAEFRRSNMVKAFELKQPIQARHVAIIDDVMTTGATVGSLSHLLKENGVEKISIWCAARV